MPLLRVTGQGWVRSLLVVPVLMDLVCKEESNVFPAILSAINTFLGRLKMKEYRSVKTGMSS